MKNVQEKISNTKMQLFLAEQDFELATDNKKKLVALRIQNLKAKLYMLNIHLA